MADMLLGAAAFEDFVRVVETAMPPMPEARFNIGQVVRHPAGLFRGVVVGVDFAFAGPEARREYLTPNPLWRPDATHYRLWADFHDGDFAETYVAEFEIEADYASTPLRNPLTLNLGQFLGGRYAVERVMNA